MVFGLEKDKPRIAAATGGGTYKSGDKVEVLVEVPESLGSVANGEVELGYDYESDTGSSEVLIPAGGDVALANIRNTRRYTVVVDRRSLTDTGLLGSPGQHSIVLQLPVESPPTVLFNKVNWWVRVVVERAEHKPVKAQAKVKVLSSREANLSHALAPGYCTPGCDLGLNVDDRSVHIGDAVTGMLTVAPAESLEAHEITIAVAPYTLGLEALQRGAKLSFPHAGKSKLAGRSTIEAGSYREYPFTLPLPRRAQELPSIETEHLQVVWVLEGRVARAWHGDYRVRVFLNVYNG